MAFEVEYTYHDRLETGGYNKEETKTLKRKVGEGFDEVPLEKLAQHIMAQLARRDIWVTDVNISEYKKAKVNFRETKGGIVIKNKRFMLDQEGTNLIAHDIVDEPAHEAAPLPGRTLAVPSAEEPDGPAKHKRVIRWVEFSPEPQQAPEIKKKGLRLTPGKKYPVFKEAEHPQGLQFGNVYTLLDDLKREVTTLDAYFVPAQIRLDGENEVDGGWSSGPSNSERDIQLNYPGLQRDDIIDVRKAAGGRRR